jgi:hypothetical protein
MRNVGSVACLSRWKSISTGAGTRMTAKDCKPYLGDYFESSNQVMAAKRLDVGDTLIVTAAAAFSIW